MPAGERVEVYGKKGTVRFHGKGGFDMIDFDNGESGFRNRYGPDFKTLGGKGKKQKVSDDVRLPR